MLAAPNPELALIYNLEIRLVQEGSGIESRVPLPGTALPPRDCAKLFIYEGKTSFQRGSIPSICGNEERRESRWRRSVALIAHWGF
jgi:hypothetical protein